MTVLILAGCVPLGIAGRWWCLRAVGSPGLVSVTGSGGDGGGGKLSGKSPGLETAGPGFGKGGGVLVEWERMRAGQGGEGEGLRELFKTVSAMEPGFRRRALLGLLVAEWAERDPAGGMDFLLGHGEAGTGGSEDGRKDGPDAVLPNAEDRQALGGELFLKWLSREPQAAMAKLRSMPKAAAALAGDATVLAAVARHAPAGLVAMAGLLTERENVWRHPVEDAFALMAADYPELAKTAAESLTGPRRAGALTGVGRAWGARDFAAAEAWAESLPKGERDTALRGALLGLATKDPQAALDRIDSVPPATEGPHTGGSTGSFLLEAAAAKDFDATMDWLREHSGKVTRDGLNGLSKAVGERLNADPVGFLEKESKRGNPEIWTAAVGGALTNEANARLPEVWAWLRRQPENRDLRKLTREVFGNACSFDPRQAIAMVESLRNSPDGEEYMSTLAQQYSLDGVLKSGRFELLTAAASPELKSKLLNYQFGGLNADSLGNGADWPKRIEQLPADQRTFALTCLASAWAGTDPVAAAAWAQSLPESVDRPAVIGKLAEKWLAWDPMKASAWVAALPEGLERDAAAGQVVDAVVTETPDDAWTWALSIGGKELRDKTLQKALKGLAAGGPEAALRRIVESSLPEEEKQQLRESLAGGGDQKPGKL